MLQKAETSLNSNEDPSLKQTTFNSPSPLPINSNQSSNVTLNSLNRPLFHFYVTYFKRMSEILGHHLLPSVTNFFLLLFSELYSLAKCPITFTCCLDKETLGFCVFFSALQKKRQSISSQKTKSSTKKKGLWTPAEKWKAILYTKKNLKSK